MLLVSLVHNSEVFIKPGNVTAVLLFESNHHRHNHNIIKKPQPHKQALLMLFAWTAGKSQDVTVRCRTITYLLVTLFGSQNLDFFTLNHGKTRSIC